MTGATHSTNWRRAVDLLRALANLARQRRSPYAEAEADRSREQLADLDGTLTAVEEDLLGGLSADLWILAGEDELGNTPSQAEREALATAESRQDWVQVSALLRDRPRLRSGVAGARLRACLWNELGETEIAAEFEAYSRRLVGE